MIIDVVRAAEPALLILPAATLSSITTPRPERCSCATVLTAPEGPIAQPAREQSLESDRVGGAAPLAVPVIDDPH